MSKKEFDKIRKMDCRVFLIYLKPHKKFHFMVTKSSQELFHRISPHGSISPSMVDAAANDQFYIRVHTLLEKMFFFSFGFRSNAEKVSKMLLQAQNMTCSWKKNFFFQIKNIFDSKKRTSLAPFRYWTWMCSFFVFFV
jgi:hypothetical protein